MKEEYLHYIFRTKQLGNSFTTTKGLKIEVLNFGYHNHSSGPDFLECKIEYEGKTWAGQIEFHVNSSDWFKHNHQHDSNYNNVIAHFVYSHDQDIKSGEYILPTVELKELIDRQHYQKYESYINSKNWIACQNEINNVDSFVVFQQKEKALFSRLFRKSQQIIDLISINNGDRLKVFYVLLFKAFGTKVNQKAFERLGTKFDYKIISKLNNDSIKVQAYLFGLSGLLADNTEDEYYNELKTEFSYLKHLYTINEMKSEEWKFSALRPANFPTIRLAQLAQVLIKFVKVDENPSVNTIRKQYKIQLSEYWQNHYMFGRVGKTKNSNLTNSFIDLLIINVYVPFLFSVGQLEDDEAKKSKSISLLEGVKSEKNGIITKWKDLSIDIKSAFDSQALIELKNEFCNKSQCLNCKIGVKLLKNG